MNKIALLLQDAAGLQRGGRVMEAAECYRAILAREPQQIVALQNAAVLARKVGDLPQALDYLRRASSLSPQDARMHFLLGLVLEESKQPEESIASLRQAIRFKPDYADAHLHLGIALHDAKQFDEAIVCFLTAIGYQPDHAKAYHNLGSSLRAQGKLAEARRQFAEATRLQPDYALAFYNLGQCDLDLGQLEAAESALAQAARLKPDYRLAFSKLGVVQCQLGKLDAAHDSIGRAAQLAGGRNNPELNNLAYIQWEQGRIEAALASYRQAKEAAPHELRAALGASLSLSAVYASKHALLAERDRFANGLKMLHASSADFAAQNRPEVLLEALRWSNFYLAYQGLQDRQMQVEYGCFVAALLNQIAPQWMQARGQKNIQGRRLRIGYLSSFFMDCTVGRYFRSWLTRLDSDLFETFAYHTRPVTDALTQEIASKASHFRHLAGSTATVSSIVATILEDDLDVLVYPELGMDNTSFLLAAMRLAPVQCAGWGHPVTSGHRNVDYYLSSLVMEPEDAAAHYSEKLVLLDGLGTCYSKPTLPTPGCRADFGLPEDKVLYLCPQSLFKIHPDNDALLVRILERIPAGVIVLFEGRHPNITQALVSRLKQGLRGCGLDAENRIVVLRGMAHDDYLRVNMLCDAMLDTLHWSGGNTTLDALACCLPIVTLPGQFMRGRQTYGMLKTMGISELIANNNDEYIQIAGRLGIDSAWRASMVQRIAANGDAIFGQDTPIRQLEQFYCRVTRRESIP